MQTIQSDYLTPPQSYVFVHARLAICHCRPRALFCFIFCIFLLPLFHSVHRPSFHAICINSTSPCRVDQSAFNGSVLCRRRASRIPLTTTYLLYHKLYEPISTYYTPQPTLRQSGYKCFTRCSPEFDVRSYDEGLRIKPSAWWCSHVRLQGARLKASCVIL